MRIIELVSYLNTTALVLGYIVLILLLAGILWMAGNWAENLHYKRYRKRRHDREWDELRSTWIEQTRANNVHDVTDRIDTVEHPRVDIDSVDRFDTDVMQTIDQIVTYQKGHKSYDAT